jgi:hypothetical protein
MPTLTTGHQLPTIAGADRPCDATVTLCALRDRLNVLLNDYDNTINRTVTAVPAAMIWRELTDLPNPTVSPDIHVPFTRLGIDTDNMVNLALDARAITVRTAGVYIMAANCQIDPVGIQNNQLFELILNGGNKSSSDMGGTTISRTTSRMYAAIAELRECFPGDVLSVTASSTDDPAGTAIEFAWFAAYWVADAF